MSFLLKRGDDNPLAAAIRQAIGASPDEDVEIETPTFNRPADWLPAMVPPTERSSWDALKALSASTLRDLGCRAWAGFTTTRPTDPASISHHDQWFWTVEDEDDAKASYELWLFPAEWYDAIPNGFPLVDINGCLELFERGKTDDDRRYGLLAYGLMVAKSLQLPSQAHHEG